MLIKSRVLLVVAAGIGAVVCAPHHASAQFVCEPGGGTASGAFSVACGPGANAAGLGATAVGDGAQATGNNATAFGAGASADGTVSTAVGPQAQAAGDGSTAVGNLAGVNATGFVGSLNTAVGSNAGQDVSGDRNVALGGRAGSVVSGDDNIAIGSEAGREHDASNTISIGNGARASADDAVAIGSGAQATHANATAIGTGATTTRDNQVALGKSDSTYTLTGLTSDASKAAQGAPTKLVTTNETGDLAAHTAGELGLATLNDLGGLATKAELTGLQSQINGLGQRDKELADGIAIAVAMAQPMLLPGQIFAVRAGYGNFDGSSALGLSAAGVVARGLSGPTSSVVVDAGFGFGTETSMAAGRAGVTFGW